MGYSTEFKGKLKFTKELTASQLSKVKTFMGQDCREHPEWNAKDLTWINLELLDDYSGIQWDDSEKAYDMPEKINMIIRQMQLVNKEFGLSGQLLAQGEDMSDRWLLVMVDNVATVQEIVITGIKVKCPHCKETFILEEANKE